MFREPPVVDENTIDHDVRLACCPHCGCGELEETGRYDDHLVEDIPEPKIALHLLRDLHELRDALSRHHVTKYVQPLITLFQDAIALAKARSTLSGRKYQAACRKIALRLETIIWQKPKQPDCRRINKRLVRHRFALLTFLEEPDVPADNNTGERDIRSVVAARNDGGVNRSDWGAHAFATLKSVIRTCQKNSLNFLDYGLSVLRAQAADCPLPLPLDAS